MNIEEAIAIIEKTFPDRKINSSGCIYEGKYCFSTVSKDYVEGTPNWDNTVAAVDIKTGEVSEFSALSGNYMTEAKPLG